jgi:hypothetical protein
MAGRGTLSSSYSSSLSFSFLPSQFYWRGFGGALMVFFAIGGALALADPVLDPPLVLPLGGIVYRKRPQGEGETKKKTWSLHVYERGERVKIKEHI